MKGQRLAKMVDGGYFSALEKASPQLANTIKSFRDRLSANKQGTFDKRANIQFKAAMNMPEEMRKQYLTQVESQFSQPSAFENIQKGLESEKFTPVYSVAFNKPKSNTQDIYKRLGMAKKGGVAEGIKKFEAEQMSQGGGVSIRGRKFKGTF